MGMVDFKETVGAEYTLAAKWLQVFDADEKNYIYLSKDRDDSFLLHSQSSSSYPGEYAKEKIKELFMPHIFITVYKFLDEILIYVYEEVMKTSLPSQMGYGIKSDLFAGKNVKYKNRKYLGLDQNLFKVTSSLGILGDCKWFDRIMRLHRNLRLKRNSFIHDHQFQVLSDKIVFIIDKKQEVLTNQDIQHLLKLALYITDQICHKTSMRKIHKLEYYYNQLSFTENITTSITFNTQEIYLLTLNLKQSKGMYITDFKDLSDKFSKTIPYGNIDYVTFKYCGNKWTIPYIDIVNKKIKLEQFSEIGSFKAYKNKQISDFEDIRSI